MRPRTPEPEYFACPNCGGEVRRGAPACPHCGSDEETGWSEAAEYVHLLPERDDPSAPAPSVMRTIGLPVGAGLLVFASLLTIGIPPTIGLPVVLLLALILLFVVRNPRNGAGFRRPGNEEQALYNRLLEQARGDRALAERLIAYEAKRNPHSDRRQHLQDAIERWERDRR
ncbi:MAG: zinc ribbon domain-containing protein [Capsulimonadales bacterium]|nr:zinc ribbon domain-containing protein [Capsulimonadales bacterium]